MKNITQDYLNQCFEYEAITGRLYWKNRPQCHFNSTSGCKLFNSQFAGKIAGGIDGRGYIKVRLNDRKYQAHRLIWILVKGETPNDLVIDHINHNRTDNRIENLRITTVADNFKNQVLRNTNTSGVSGVSWYERYGKWVARINHKEKRICLGYFENKDDAISVRQKAEINFGYHYNHGMVRV